MPLPLKPKKQQLTVSFGTAAMAAIKGPYKHSAVMVQTLRQHTGLNQADFGARTGIDQGYVSKCERGLHSMALDRFARACEVVGVDFDITFHSPKGATPRKRARSTKPCP